MSGDIAKEKEKNSDNKFIYELHNATFFASCLSEIKN